MACMTAKTGTLIFAIINIIIVTIATAGYLGLLAYAIAICSLTEPSRKYRSDGVVVYTTPLPLSSLVIPGIMLLIPLITLVFSSLLLHGILKKKAGYVKAYFIYGVLVVVVTLMALVGAVASSKVSIHGSETISILFVYTAYGHILRMIRRAVVEMESQTGLYAPKVQNLL